jgi:hypothetical protein
MIPSMGGGGIARSTPGNAPQFLLAQGQATEGLIQAPQGGKDGILLGPALPEAASEAEEAIVLYLNLVQKLGRHHET